MAQNSLTDLFIENDYSDEDRQKNQAFKIQAREALHKASLGDRASLQALMNDPIKLRTAMNASIDRIEGSERLFLGTHYSALQNSYSSKRFDERGLPDLNPEKLQQWAKEMLSSGQNHPLKQELASIETRILKGDVAGLKQIFTRAPMAPWVMDFSLRQYEAENLLMFACKYAPEPADFDIIDLIVSEGLHFPARNNYLRLESSTITQTIAAWQSKGGPRVGACLERAGWQCQFDDYIWLFAYRSEDSHGLGSDPLSCLKEKIEIADWIKSHGVDPTQRMSLPLKVTPESTPVTLEATASTSAEPDPHGISPLKTTSSPIAPETIGYLIKKKLLEMMDWDPFLQGDPPNDPTMLDRIQKADLKVASYQDRFDTEKLTEMVGHMHVAALLIMCEKEAARGGDSTFGLEELLTVQSATLRDENEWAILAPWLIQEGIDLMKMRRLSEQSGHQVTADRLLPWAEKQALEIASRPAKTQTSDVSDTAATHKPTARRL